MEKESRDQQYCDDCGDPIEGDNFIPFSELPFNVASANEGESAIVCMSCLKKHDWDLCYVCKKPVDCGGGHEVGSCDSCKKVFHTACDEGWHKEGFSHYCTACLPK